MLLTIDKIMEKVNIRFGGERFTYELLNEDSVRLGGVAQYMLTLIEDGSKQLMITIPDPIFETIICTAYVNMWSVDSIADGMSGNIFDMFNIIEKLIEYQDIEKK